MAGHVVQQGQALIDGFVHRAHFVGASLAHPFHDTLRFGFLPQLVEGISRFGSASLGNRAVAEPSTMIRPSMPFAFISSPLSRT